MTRVEAIIGCVNRLCRQRDLTEYQFNTSFYEGLQL